MPRSTTALSYRFQRVVGTIPLDLRSSNAGSIIGRLEGLWTRSYWRGWRGRSRKYSVQCNLRAGGWSYVFQGLQENVCRGYRWLDKNYGLALSGRIAKESKQIYLVGTWLQFLVKVVLGKGGGFSSDMLSETVRESARRGSTVLHPRMWKSVMICKECDLKCAGVKK